MKKDRLIPALAVLCILSLAVMVTALQKSGAQGSFIPPPFEPAALAGTPAVPQGLGYRELDVQNFRVGLCGSICLREGAAEVWFVNPQNNSVWLRLRFLDEAGNMLGQTGLLRPGEYVACVPVAGAEPGMPVVLKVMAYEPDTYRSAGALTLHSRIGE